jgi:fatty acid desaturase
VLTVNDAISRYLIHSPLLMDLNNSRKIHLAHHRALGTMEDPDRHLHVASNKNSKLRFLAFTAGLLTVGAAVLRMTPFGNKRVDQQKKEIKTEKWEYLKGRSTVLLMQMILFGLFYFLRLPLWSYFVLWIAPIYVCVFLADEIRAFSEHAVLLLPDENADPERLITFNPAWLEARVFSPHNMNYHAEHHLWVSVPYYNLTQVHQWVKSRPEVTQRTSYTAFLWTFFSAVPLDEKR